MNLKGKLSYVSGRAAVPETLNAGISYISPVTELIDRLMN